LDEIYKRWKCDLKSCKNYGHYCWVDDADSKHYTFDSGDASRWAKSIPDHASIDRPSDRLRTHLMRKDAGKRRDSNTQTTTSSHGNIHNHFNFSLPSTTPYPDRRFPAGCSPQDTPIGRRYSRHMPSTSPPLSDPDGHAEIDRYFDWLINKYPADKAKLIHAKETLHERDLDLKSLRKMDNGTLENWSITWGIADKIRREIKTFQKEDIY
jgi:hypothetical protein